MIIVERRNLAFIHIPKTAGSSLTRMLFPHISPRHLQDTVFFDGPGWQETHHVNEQHATFGESLDYLRDQALDPDAYRFVTIVRNPYDWIGSVWNSFDYKKQYRTLKEYLVAIDEQDARVVFRHRSQSDYVRSDGAVPIRCYQLEDEAPKKICGDFDLPFDGEVHLLHRSKYLNKVRFYDYDEESIRLVNELFAEDFERFGYEVLTTVEQITGLFSE
jgi:hypothetical protein